MGQIIQLSVNGIAMGMIYALMAMGLIMLLRAVGVLNFAQGDLLMLGAFIAYFFIMQGNIPVFAAYMLSLLVFVLVGVIFMLTCYWPVRNAKWSIAIIVCTIGASIVIREGAKLIWGGSPLPVTPVVAGTINILDAKLEIQYLFIIAASIVILLLVYFLFEKLFPGKLMQAASQDPYAAQLIGIPPMLTTMLTYTIVVSIVGYAGFLVAPIFLASVNLSTLQLRAFAGAIIGGFGDLRGALIGCLLVGLIESFSIYVTSTYKDAIVFGVMLIFLILRPEGIFKSRMGEKA